jgi:putative ABC transport system permease protein
MEGIVENFLQELAVKKVLSQEDILLLKEYIAKKYRDYSSDYRSGILTNAVHQILDNNIPGIDKEYIKTIKQHLLESILSKNVQAVMLIDVLNVCISIQNKSSAFYDDIISWINSHVRNKINRTDIEKYDIKVNCKLNAGTSYIPEENTLECRAENNIVDIDAYDADAVTVVGTVAVTDADRNITNIKRTINFIRLKSITDFIRSRSISLSSGIIFISCIFLVSILFLLNNYRFNPPQFYKRQQVTQVKLNIESILSDSYNGTAELILNNLFNSGLPNNFKYKDINQLSLKKFLNGRKSLLAYEPYFSTIIAVSKEYNLNPLLLFAISGQEQGFVSKESSSSNKIANNPFNIYHSWKKYNTNIADASKIACITIINLCKDRPHDENPLSWINKKYAEDQNWANSVGSIYNNLEKNNLIFRGSFPLFYN